MSNYVVTHLHSDLSLLDSCTQFKDYVARAVELGHTAIASTEHGRQMGWIGKKMACDAAGIKFLHGVEIYLTEALLQQDENGEMHKVRDNYHTILIAKNLDGVKELNEMVSMSCQPDHTYFVNRLSFDEFLSLSNNIIKTSACLSSPLYKLPVNHPYYERLVKAYDYLEVQPHNDPEQVSFNVHLAELAEKYHKPLIAGTDTHSLNDYKAKCRSLLLESKHKSYGNEDNFDLTYHSYDELVAMFAAQGALPEKLYMQAIENTNALADQCENWELDTSLKYPILYGSREKDHEMLQQTIDRKLADKIATGIIPPEQADAFRKACDEEMRVFTKVEMDGFMLSMSELISWCKEHDIPIGPGRGSVGGSRVAYVTDIIDINPEKWHTVFSRFCNEDRKEVGDIDVDCIDTDRPKIFEYIINRFGRDKTARVASYGTLVEKGTIDEIGRAFMYRWNEANGRKFDDKSQDNPWNYSTTDKIKKMYLEHPDDAKAAYPEFFECFDGLVGTKISQSVHPAGMVISPITLADNYGVFDKDGELCLFADMDEVHDCGLVKYDLLLLKNIKIIRDACAYAGIQYPKMHEIDWNDPAVYADIIKSQVGIFQFEGDFAHQLLRQYKPQSIFDITIVTACIRPSGASYRNDLIARKPHHNPSKLIDDLLSDNNGYLCIAEGQTVMTPDGCVPIEKITIESKVYTENGIARVTDQRKTGHKDTVKITAGDFSLQCTSDHKILSEHGWMQAGEIHVGDSIAVRVGCNSNKTAPKHILRMLAYLIGDGCLTRSNEVSMCNKNLDVIRDFANSVSRFNNCTTRIDERQSRVNKLSLYYGFVKYIEQHKTPNAVTNYLRSIGLKYYGGGGCAARDKFIPEFIFGLSANCITEFLGAFTDTDCCIKQKTPTGFSVIAAYKTASERLAYDLCELIRRLGFLTKTTYNTETDSWCVGVINAKDYLNQLYDYSFKIKSTYSRDDLIRIRPRLDSVISLSTAEAIIDAHNVTGINRAVLRSQSYVSIDRLRTYISEYGDGVCDDEHIFNENLRWVPVSGLDEMNDVDVYDLTVESEHNFVCGGIVVHNCYQEDIIQFLQQVCGLSGSEADTVRRGIARKKPEILEKALPQILDGYCAKSDHPRDVAEEEAKEFLQIIDDASSYMFGYNHAIGYSLISYLCAWLRCYYPLEFITAYLNNAANDDDIKSGSELAQQYKIQIVSPRYGESTDVYFFDKEKNIITKGVGSIRDMNNAVARDLYELSKSNPTTSFIDLLYLLRDKTSLRSNQLDHLLKIDYFQDFGNIPTLTRILQFFDLMKQGTAKQIKKDKVSPVMESIIAPFATDKRKDGSPAASWTITDMNGLLHEAEDEIRKLNLPDLDMKVRIQNYLDILGYIGLQTGKPEDRCKLIVTDVWPLNSTDNGLPWAYRLGTQSIGTGKTASLTTYANIYDKHPLRSGDLIETSPSDVYKNSKGYWYIKNWRMIA